MRRLDEQSKIVNFWDNWIKTISAMKLPNDDDDARSEIRIRSVISSARHLLAEAGANVVGLYSASEFTLAEFQAYRAGLPWYRRVLLLYRAPNKRARLYKVGFHLCLWAAVCVLAVAWIAHLFGREIFEAADRLPPPHGEVRTLLGSLNILSALQIFAVVCIIVYYRYASIECEKSERYYTKGQTSQRFSGGADADSN
jgi:hypothetical protein